jgi:molybdate transport system substrate-binding protein
MRALLFGLLLVVSTACQSKTAPKPVELTVLAAASLREAFGDLAREFSRREPGAQVVFSFAGSQTLRTQIEQGAPADVFASADFAQITPLVRAGLLDDSKVFALNEPVLAVTLEQSKTLRELADLPNAARIVLGGDEVPIGRYGRKILANATPSLGADFATRVDAKVVSREPDVRQVLAKLLLGEADAGIVYRTDAKTAAGKLAVVVIPKALNVISEYPIARLKRSTHAEMAGRWIAFVLSADGRRLLEARGFGTP